MTSKSELKRLATLDPIGMAERMHMLERKIKEKDSRIAELELSAEEWQEQVKSLLNSIGNLWK